MSKKVTYEVDFVGRDGASAVADKIVSAVTAAQQSSSSAIQKVNTALKEQGAVASSSASKTKTALASVSSGASASANGIQTISRSISESQKKAVADVQTQKSAVKSLSSQYTSTYNELKSSLESGQLSMSELQGMMEIQKTTIADLSAKYKQLKADKDSDKGKVSGTLSELESEREALSAMRDAANNYRQSATSLRTQLMSLRNDMGKLRLEGKENTREYEEMRRKMEELGTAYRELQTEQTALSTGATQIGGVINGVQGLMGLYSAGSGIVSMFTKDNEKLMEVQTKMQSVMAVMMGIQQLSNTLHATSAFRIVTCRKVTELWTTAQNRLTVSIGLTNVASKALMATMTLGASLIITTLIAAISKLVSKHKEQKEAQEKAKKAEEDAQKSMRSTVANSIASQLISYRKLQNEWKACNGNAEKQRKFIKNNANEFNNLGVKVKNARDAENLLVSNETAFVESLKRKAMAAAAMELASNKYKAAIEKMLEAEKAKEVTEDDRKNARNYAEGVYQQKLSGASGPVGRGQVNAQKSQIVNSAYSGIIGTYGAERAKTYQDAAKKEMKEGDRYFSIVKKYNDEADRLLSGGGITSTGNDPGALSGSIDAIEQKIQALTESMKAASATERNEIQKDINAWNKKLEAVNLELESLGVPADPQTLKDLETAISYYDKLLKVASADERAEIQSTINAYKQKKSAIEDALAELSMPVDLKSFEDYSKAISILENKLDKASGSEREQIQATINAYKREEDEIRARIALASTPAVLNSLQDYEDAISNCEAVLKYADEQERAAIQKIINEYKRKKQAIEDSLDALNVPAEPKSLEDYGIIISSLESRIQKAGDVERKELQKQLELYRQKQSAMEQSLQLVNAGEVATMLESGFGLDDELEIKLRARIVGAELAKSKIQELQKMAAVAQTDDERASIKGAIKQWQEYAVNLETTVTKGQQATACLEGMSSIANSLSGVVGENASGWLSWGANVLAAVAQALPAIASLIGGNIAQAFAGAAAQSQSVPFPYNLISLAASMAAVGAAVAAIPKYADGGIAYGPTFGLFGEYAGASHNPEVVAPLDKLKSIIGINDSGSREIEFKIRGRNLVGVQSREIKRRKRS